MLGSLQFITIFCVVSSRYWMKVVFYGLSVVISVTKRCLCNQNSFAIHIVWAFNSHSKECPTYWYRLVVFSELSIFYVFHENKIKSGHRGGVYFRAIKSLFYHTITVWSTSKSKVSHGGYARYYFACAWWVLRKLSPHSPMSHSGLKPYVRPKPEILSFGSFQ